MIRARILCGLAVALLAPAGFFSAVAQCDAEAPTLVDFDFNPQSIDVTAGDQAVVVVFDVTDDLSGVERVGVQFTSPSFVQTVGCNSTVPLSGTSTNGTYQCVATFPRYSESGNWFVDQITLPDRVGRSSGVFEDDLIARGLPTVLQVTSVPDVAPPVLTGLALAPTSVNVSTGPGQVDCTITATDNLAGISAVFCTLTSPGETTTGCAQTIPASGTPTDGTYTCTMTVPRYAENADWDLSVTLGDTVDNNVEITTQELTLAGLPDGVTVVSVPDDLAPPVLLDFDLQPQEVNVENADRTVTCSAQLTDALAGTAVFGCSGTFIDAAFDIITQACSSLVPDSGTPANGNWSCDLTIPQYSPGGTWGFVTTLFFDAVGNSDFADSTALLTAGFPASFDVICGNPAPPSPVISWFDDTIVSWAPIGGAIRYTLYGGSLSLLSDVNADGLPDGGYGLCRNGEDPNPTDTLFLDTSEPAPGTGTFLLIGYDTLTEQDLGLGTTSGGQGRFTILPCP